MVDKSSSVELDLLIWIVSPWSNNSSVCMSVEVAELITDGIVSSLVVSDRSSSVIKIEPLVVVEWLVILDSKSVLMRSDVLINSECSGT